MITSNPLDGDRAPARSAMPLPGVERADRPAARRPGVIEVRGPNVFAGYWRMPEKTAEEFTADGYFITGDVGGCDADGYV